MREASTSLKLVRKQGRLLHLLHGLERVHSACLLYRTTVRVWECIHASGGLIYCTQFSIGVLFIISTYTLYALTINLKIPTKCI